MEQYKRDFETFLQHTDEKEVLRQKLLQIMAEHQVESLLDLGAGNGDLAIPLSQAVANYVAVEPRPGFAERLIQADVSTIASEYPCEVPGQFDLVLICHVLSRKRELWEPFVTAAWEKVKPGGNLLIVSYRGQKDDWTDLMDALSLHQLDKSRSSYEEMLTHLKELGQTEVEIVTTRVITDETATMIQALSFVAGNGLPEPTSESLEKQSLIKDILEKKYRPASKYEFPFQHFFITVKKSAQS